MKIRNLYLGDPKDLSQRSSGAFSLFIQMDVLDFTRRYYNRQDDETSKLRSEEIKKLIHKISEMQTIAVRTLVPKEIIHRHFDLMNKKTGFLKS